LDNLDNDGVMRDDGWKYKRVAEKKGKICTHIKAYECGRDHARMDEQGRGKKTRILAS